MIHEYDEENIAIGSRFRNQFLAPFLSWDLHEFTDGFIGDGWGVSRCLFLSIVFWGMMGIVWQMVPNLPLFAFEWLLGTSPVWLPVIGLITAWKVWIWYAQGSYLFKRDSILLEVKMPREITRSPRAMENALSTLWIDSGVTTFFNTAWQGQVLPYFSFEIASFGGEVHFYIWCWRAWRPNVEAMMYAYYPEVEIYEVEDYASKFRFDPDKHEAFPTDWRFEPRNDAYPIKTYIDFELDKDPKDEYKIDPLAEVIEKMSSLRPDEQMWVQIIITLSKDQRRVKGEAWWHTESRFIGTIKEEIEKIRKESAGDVEAEPWRRSVRVPQYRQTELIKSMDRNMGKHPFNVGLRGVYISDADKFAAPGYTGLRWLWRPMGNPQFQNQLRPRRWGNPFDYPWQDFKDIRWRLMQRRFFDTYRRRSHFYSPWIFPFNTMSTEVIATIWHPPGANIVSPGLERIAATKAEPPSNLPK